MESIWNVTPYGGWRPVIAVAEGGGEITKHLENTTEISFFRARKM
jgi:hypothetical protein